MTERGAFFHRCDFQVHSPRDINWYGQRPVTEEEKKEYAADFIDACRSRFLNAVAITDHHDISFFPYIKEAADQEIDELGNPVKEAEKITVFPGMELTLAVPCQAILILPKLSGIKFTTKKNVPLAQLYSGKIVFTW